MAMTHITTSRDLAYIVRVTDKMWPWVSTVTASRDAGHGGLPQKCVEIFHVGSRDVRLDKAESNSEKGSHARAY